MPLVSGTSTRYNIKGDREDLADVIYNISPEDTPFLSMAGGGTAKSTLHEWQTDSLADVDTNNAHLEGDEAAFETPTPTVRVGNYTQISRKTAIVSGTVEKINKAGRKSELAFEISKRGREIKRDQESILLSNQGGDPGGVGTARRLASLGAWLKSAVNHDTNSGGNPTYTAGVPLAARTDATSGDLRAFTETILKDVIQKVWTNGGDPKILMVGPFNKQAVSTFPGIATRNFDLSNVKPRATAVIASVDVYVGDLGTVRVVPNRFQRERDAWLLDPDLVSVPTLRPYMKERLSKTGDNIKEMLLVEYTLRVNQEAGLGLAADLTTA